MGTSTTTIGRILSNPHAVKLCRECRALHHHNSISCDCTDNSNSFIDLTKKDLDKLAKNYLNRDIKIKLQSNEESYRKPDNASIEEFNENNYKAVKNDAIFFWGNEDDEYDEL